jgi:hypothetical protein
MMRICVVLLAAATIPAVVWSEDSKSEPVWVFGKNAETVKDGTDAVVQIKGGGENTEIGRVAWLKDVQFTDGTIECEVKSVKRNDRGHNYLGLVFRVLDEKQYDLVYLRWRNDAVFKDRELQYVPVKDGIDRWRDFREKYNAPRADLKDGEWVKLRLTVEGKSAALYFGEEKEPALKVTNLQSQGPKGSVGVWAFPTSGTGQFRNFKVTLAK